MNAECHGLRGTAVLPSTRSAVLAFLIVTVLVFPIVLGLGMTRGMNHDEHQHVAAGALVAREGLLPYRDFPHFHTPYLPFAYAAMFRATDHLLTAARQLSVFCSSAILGIIGSFAYILFRKLGMRFASLVSAGSVLLALTTTLFTGTVGRAWNHEPSLFLVLFAFVAHIAGMRSGRLGWFVVGGVLLGLAIGTRITCAPLVAPFGLAPLLYPHPSTRRWRQIISFGGGLLLGLAGLIYLFATAPEQAYFDNFGFAKANIVYRFSEGAPRTMTLPTKLRFFVKEIMRPDIALFLAGLLPLIVAYLSNRRTGQKLPVELSFLLFLLPFVLVGSFAPSPAFDQYFLPMVPWLLLIGLFALSSISAENAWFRRLIFCGAAAVLVSVVMGVRGFDDIKDYFKPAKWEGNRLHRRAQEIRSHVRDGRILTLAPTYPLEAGLSIYPAFSTGPFAWRISPYIEPAKAARIGIVTPLTLNGMLEVSPPAGVLVGFEEDDEEDDFNDYARRAGSKLVPLADEHQLWVNPRREYRTRPVAAE
jgi:4-amino-4-deoxy-L-arabinose transferase-like glycosyltransferase